MNTKSIIITVFTFAFAATFFAFGQGQQRKANRAAAAALAALMLGAVLMHLKVGDPVRKYFPATSLLVMCCVVTALA